MCAILPLVYEDYAFDGKHDILPIHQASYPLRGWLLSCPLA